MDTWNAIEADLEEVFGYREDKRPQDRAHAYIERRKVMRGFNDTAMQVAATDMCRRSYELGGADALAEMPEVQAVAAELTEASGKLLGIAVRLRGMDGTEGVQG